MKTKTLTIDELCNIEYGTRVTRRKDSKDSGKIYPVYGGGGETFFVDKINRKNRVVIARFAMSEKCTRLVKGDFFLNDSGLTLSPKTSELSQEYLDKIILASNYSIYLLGKGAAQRNLDMKRFKLLKISFPTSLVEQQRIVTKIDDTFAKIDKLVQINKSKLSSLRNIEKKIINKLILNNGSNFVKRPIRSLFNLSSGKFLPRKKMSLKGKIKVYGGNGITGYHDVFNLENENILIGRVGAYCGNVYYTNERIWLTDNCLHISSYQYDFDKKFLSMLLSNLNLRAYANQAAQPAISYTSLKDIELTFPKSINEQSIIFKKYIDLKNNFKNLNDNYESQRISFQKLRFSVLNKEIFNITT